MRHFFILIFTKFFEKMKIIFKSVSLVALMIFGLSSYAQTVVDAGQKFNAANQQMNANAFSQAVSLYEQALKTTKAVGPDAADLQGQIENQLTIAYFKNGISLYKKRQFDQAIAQLEKSKQMAKTTKNAKFTTLCTTYISRVYYSKGMSFINNKELAQATAQFEQALKVQPNSIYAIFGKSLVAKEQGNMPQMMLLVDKLGEMAATNPKAANIYNKAQSMAFRTLMNNGASELQKEHTTKSLEYLKDALKYHAGTSNLFYYVAIANIKLSRWSDAIVAAKKAIVLANKDKSDLYFTLGQAYQGKKDKANACKSFKQVVKGPNVAAAKYQIKQVLKCS